MVSLTLVIYDISDNGLRSAVEKKCKSYGLKHIQRSAFIGYLSKNMRESLYLELLNMLEGKEGNIRLYKICKKCFSDRLNIGSLEGFDDEPTEEGVIVA